MLYYRQVPNLSQTNLNEIYASQTASIERGGHPDMEFLQRRSTLVRPVLRTCPPQLHLLLLLPPFVHCSVRPECLHLGNGFSEAQLRLWLDGGQNGLAHVGPYLHFDSKGALLGRLEGDYLAQIAV